MNIQPVYPYGSLCPNISMSFISSKRYTNQRTLEARLSSLVLWQIYFLFEISKSFQDFGLEFLPMESTFTSQPNDFVVVTNQSRADLSASDSARRDMPISVSPLLRCQKQWSN
jgi:hypothetical protein